MKLDLSKPIDQSKAITYITKLIESEKLIELKEIRKVRTIKQNSYLHTIITLYAIHFGDPLEIAKTDLKRECSFMRLNHKGKQYLKSTAKLDTKELTDFIEWVRNYSSQNGCYLPTASEYLEDKFNIDKDIDNNKQYL
tara:strand:+ start:583 stop:996 length:414 start_codon:yes stop_codon:yes gene_type:complete